MWNCAYPDPDLALAGLGEHAEAAMLFVKSTNFSRYNSESLEYLENFLDEHEVVHLQVPEVKAEVKRCRQLVMRKGTEEGMSPKHM